MQIALGASSTKRVRALTDSEISEVVGGLTFGQAMTMGANIANASGYELVVGNDAGGGPNDWDLATDSANSKVIVFRGSSS